MKKIKFLSALIVLFSAFTFISCDNEPIDSAIDPSSGGGSGGGGGGGGTVTGTFKVDFDGQTFVANVTQAIVNSEYIAISGLKTSTGEFFQITIPNGTVGTYTWDDFDSTGMGLGLVYSNGSVSESSFVSVSNGDVNFADFPEYNDTAEVNIVSLNSSTNNITGTFKFTGVRFTDDTGDTIETKEFTNGQFNLTYTSDTTSPSDNSFFAKLNGASFNPTNVDGYNNSGVISIIGRRGAVENINLAFPNTITPGTYNIEFGGTYMGNYILNSTGEGVFGGETGTVTIISHNTSTKRIKGTFNFNATSFFSTATYNVTEGTFEVTYL
ncbi:DUF6252 family protein [Flavobacterium sp.]|uniref:DUF6252 family protein n=1 Tax=Flavobacterium sp. TaxID=239 RepID=UPI0026110F3D|nr:DUF6252 family protein [Flavobacterium sp.]